MNRIRKDNIAILAVAVCFILIAPVISLADPPPFLDRYFGPGSYSDVPVVINQHILRDFDMRDPETPYTGTPFRLIRGISITVENGTEEGKHRVASAQVFLDDEEIFDQNDFNNHYTSITENRFFDVFPPQMVLDVKVNGSKKSQLRVTVKGIYR